MSKERINVTIDAELKQILQARDDINVSGAANAFFWELVTGESTDTAALKAQAERLRGEIAEDEAALEAKRQQLAAIEQAIEDADRRQREALDDELERLAAAQTMPSPTNAPIAKLADEHDADPESLAERLADLRNMDVHRNGGLS